MNKNHKILIIDYGAGNISSIKNMLLRLGYDSVIGNSPKEIINADKLILPGVGHFDYGMINLESSDLIDSLNWAVLDKRTPILGICLGAQLMNLYSEEGGKRGLGWLKANVVKFNKDRLPGGFKVPHMGWNKITLLRSSKLFVGLPDELRFYFVHSYYFVTAEIGLGLASTEYGYTFLSVLEKDNIYAVQFHPEKSHKYGLRLMNNFVLL